MEGWSSGLRGGGGPVSHQARRVAYGQEAFDKLRNQMKAASYTAYGVDLRTLFSRWDKDASGRLDAAELHTHINRMLPGVVGSDDLHRLIALMDKDDDGGIDFNEFSDFVLGENNTSRAGASVGTFAPTASAVNMRSDTTQQSAGGSAASSVMLPREVVAALNDGNRRLAGNPNALASFGIAKRSAQWSRRTL